MSLSLGELVGYIRGDDSQFIHTLDESDRRMGRFQTDANGRLRMMAGQFGERGAAMGRALGTGIEETLSALHPEVMVDADTLPADEGVAELYRRLESLGDAEIGVDIPPDQALRELDEIHAALTELSSEHPDVQVQANTRDAIFTLDLLRQVIDEVDAEHPVVEVDVEGAAHAEEELAMVNHEANNVGNNDAATRQTSKMQGLIGVVGAVGGSFASMPAMIAAGIPVAAGLAAALVSVAPAAAIGATGIMAMASAAGAIKIGTMGVGAAITAAFAPATATAGAAANAANQYANAQRGLKDAISNAAYSNRQAVQQVASAERSLTTAQQAAKQAQLDLTQARKDAARQLQDQNNSLKDAQLAQRQAVMDATAAEKNLAYLKALGFGATKDQLAAAQLQNDQAQQALIEQNLSVNRLQTDTTAANKAGVEGSKTVVDAKKQVASANQTVSNQELALANSREQQARTAYQGMESVLMAQQALAQSAVKSSGGVNALAQAMARLSPNARAFVQQLIALKPALEALKTGVQDALFKGLAKTLQSTAASVLPVVKRGLTDAASAMNDMAKGAMGAAKNLADSGVLGQAMHSASTGLHNLSGIPGIVVTAFGQLSAAAGPSFERLTKAIGGAAASIGKSLGDAFKSGALQSAIETAVGLIKEIGKIAANVFSVIGSIMKATAQSGGGFLGALVTISGALKTTFASPDVQAGLRALFGVMTTLAKSAAPLLNQAIRGIAPVLTALGPPVKILIENLGKALQPVIKALGPVLVEAAKAVGALVEALAPLLPVIGDIIAQVLPVLIPVFKIMGDYFKQMAPIIKKFADQLGPILTPVIKTLGEAFKLLAPVISQVAEAIGPILTPVISGLGKILQQMVSQYASMFLQVLRQLIPVIPQLIPVAIQFGEALGQILTQLAPLIPQIMLLAAQFITQLLPALLPLVKPLTELTILLLRFGTYVLVHVIGALTGLVGWFNNMRKKLQPAYDAVKWLTDKIAGAFEWLYDHLVGHSVIPDMINSIVRWFSGLPGRAWNALSSFGSRIARRAADAGAAMVSAIRSKLTSAISWISGLPGRALDALGDLSGFLYKSGQSLINGFVDGIKSMGNIAGNAASGLLNLVSQFFPHSPAEKGPFSGKGWTLHSGAATALAFAGGITSGERAVSSAAQSLMNTAQRGLTNTGPMGNLIAGSGSDNGAAGGGGSSSAGSSSNSAHRVIITLAGPEEVKKFIRHIVTTDAGGDVQRAFGY